MVIKTLSLPATVFAFFSKGGKKRERTEESCTVLSFGDHSAQPPWAGLHLDAEKTRFQLFVKLQIQEEQG